MTSKVHKGGREATGGLLWKSGGWYGRCTATTTDGKRVRVVRALGTTNRAAAMVKLKRMMALPVVREGRRIREETPVQGGDCVVYVIAAEGLADRCKVGLTTDIAARLDQLHTGSPLRLRVVAVEHGGRDLEHAVHRRLLDSGVRRVSGVGAEWFHIAPDSAAKVLRDVAVEPEWIDYGQASNG
jgi:hypothetical protein